MRSISCIITMGLADQEQCDCPIFNLLQLLGKKRILHIIKEMDAGEETFTGLQKKLHNLNAKSLSMRLDELKETQIVERKLISEDPVKIRYYLTKKWKDLAVIVRDLMKRSTDNFGNI